MIKIIDEKINQNESLKVAGLILFIYGIVEIQQFTTSLLIASGIIPNFNLIFFELLFPGGEISEWFTEPILYLPLSIMIAPIRFMSGMAVLKNKLYGFWLGIIGSLLTIFIIVTTLQINAFMMPFHAIIIILLLQGHFKDRSLIE